MRAALYARVSTERQERQQTIDSQLAALRAWVADHGHALADEHVFRDEGYSGGRLDRPGLDALRDAVRDGAVEVVAVPTPDRLAREYAYQVLLLEESRRAGCAVAFLQHPISDDPNDRLLPRIQGAIAEHERAVPGERLRRGKLQRARDGRYLSGRAPTATATCRAGTPCLATLRWTSTRPRRRGCSTAGPSTSERPSARSPSA
jgi:site-specific DNA recombinase